MSTALAELPAVSSRTLSLELRPQSFAEVLGQAATVAAIRKQLASGVVAAGWLLQGPPGTGKTTLARLIARALPGNEGIEPEIIEANAADRNGVDDIRELVRAAEYQPLVGRYRCVILDEAQQLTGPAQNVLLPPLERTDSATVWLFCTTDATKLIKPLRDRCLAFTLRTLGERDLGTLARLGCERLGEIPGTDLDAGAFVKAALKAEVTAPRAFLMALEKFAAGVPLAEALATAEHEPTFAEIARAVLGGDWDRTRQQLEGIKSADYRSLRAVVGVFLKNDLLRSAVNARADAISECLLGLGAHTAFEDGVAAGHTTAVLYRCAKKLKG